MLLAKGYNPIPRVIGTLVVDENQFRVAIKTVNGRLYALSQFLKKGLAAIHRDDD